MSHTKYLLTNNFLLKVTKFKLLLILNNDMTTEQSSVVQGHGYCVSSQGREGEKAVTIQSRLVLATGADGGR